MLEQNSSGPHSPSLLLVCPDPLTPLRTYTKEFATKMVELLPSMIDGIPPRPRHNDAEEELTRLWNETDGLGDMWIDAGMPDLFKYLIGAKGLAVPQKWEWLIPSHL